jgi:CubicO group peptidase (beta-lactamase class C family)
MSRSVITWLGCCLSLVASIAFAAPSEQSIKQSIQRAMDEFQVPGMAVSVVHGGSVIYSGGLGVREVGKKGAVDDRTLFQIGSVSKAFTAASLGVLVDEGKVQWDAPVIDYLPEFRMYDAWVTREFTVRDLLTHRSGLPLGAGDLLIFPDAKSTREEVIHAMRYFEPASSFRSKFDYDNLLYIVAGEVAARVADMPFEEFLEQRLLRPLGMDDCVATLDRVGNKAKTATPHVLVDGTLETTGSLITAVASAAGGINCSARSMTNWMSFVLSKGLAADGSRLISEAQFAQLLGPVTLLPASGYLVEHAGAYLNAYALGWNVSTFYGQKNLSHGGGVWGMTTFLMILPEQGLAVFASGNQLSAAPRAVVNDLVDQFLAGTVQDAGKDWIAIISELTNSRQAKGAETVAQAEAARAVDSKPSLELAAYAGRYRDPWYGNIQVELQDDGSLWFRSERSEPLQGPLEHFQYDTFIARWTDRRLNADAYVSFSLDPQGRVERIRMKAVSPTTDFSFDFHDLDLERVE